MDDDRRSQLAGFAGSLLLHALVVVPFLLLTPAGTGPEKRDGSKDQAVVVTLIPLDGVAGGVTSEPAVPQSAYDDATLETSPVSVDREVSLASETSDSIPPEPVSEAPPPEGGSAAPGNDDIRSYQRVLLLHIERFRGYPEDERNRHIEGTVLVRFAMTRQGSILDAWVDRSSGVSALDDEALATVHRAQPLPMIPASLPDRLSIVLPVSFSVQ